MVADRAVDDVFARLGDLGLEGGALPGLEILLELELALRRLDLEVVRRLAVVREVELDDAGLVDLRVGGIELEVDEAHVDRGDGLARRLLLRLLGGGRPSAGSR